MTAHDEYFEYLRGRSRLGNVYRKYLLYPALCRRLEGRMLDVGCGIGDMLVYRKNTVGVDVNPRTVEFCKLRAVEAYLMVADALPFASGDFDSVLMDNVLEHIVEPQPLLREVRRVLKPNGSLLIGVPGSRGWDSDADHKVRYTRDSLVEAGRAAGFMHRETFHMPCGRSEWLDRNMRQYCIYALFALSQ